MNIAAELVYTSALLFGGVAGIVVRIACSSELTRKQIYRAFSSFAIGILLPIHIFSTIIRQKSLQDLDFFIVLLLAGAGCCLSILIVSHVITRTARFRSATYPHYQYIASTFAGGGRAVVILAAVLPVFGGLLDERLRQQGTALDALAIFDVGYWLFYTVLVYYGLMGHSYQGSSDTSVQQPKFGWENWGIIVAAGLSVTAQLFDTDIASLMDRDTLDTVRWLLVFGIVFLSTAAITLVANLQGWTTSFRAMGFVIGLRALGLAIPFGILYLFGGWLLVIWLPIMLFLVSPPSSWIDKMLSSKNAPHSHVVEAATINLVWNVAMIVVVVALVISGVIVSRINGGIG